LANIKSQIKRNRQTEKRRLLNRTSRGSARAAIRDARGAVANGEESQAAVTAAISSLDVAAIHPRNAARRKSRLMKAMNKAIANPVKPVEKKSSAKKTSAKK